MLYVHGVGQRMEELPGWTLPEGSADRLVRGQLPLSDADGREKRTQSALSPMG